MQKHPVPGPVLPVAAPSRSGHSGPAEPSAVGELVADAVGQILGVDVGHHQRRNLVGAVAGHVVAHGVDHGLTGPRGAGVLVLPALLGPDLLGSGWIPVAEQIEGVAVSGVHLAAIDGQPGRPDDPGGGQGFDVIGGPASANRLRLAGIAQHPYRPVRAGVHRGQDRLDLGGGGLRDLVEHDHRPGRQGPVGQVDAQPGDRAGVQAGAGQLGDRLSVKTVRNIHTMLHKALADAARKGTVPRNVAALADPPRLSSAPRPEMKVWDADQLRRFLEEIAGHRLYPAFYLLADTFPCIAVSHRTDCLTVTVDDTESRSRQRAVDDHTTETTKPPARWGRVATYVGGAAHVPVH